MNAKPHYRHLGGAWQLAPRSDSCPQLLPGPELLAAVRAAFVARRTSLHRFCSESGMTAQWARQVLIGKRTGPCATKARNRLARAAGLESFPGGGA